MNNELESMQELHAVPTPEPQVERAIEPCDVPKEWRPSHNEALREHEVSFRFLSRGCIVRVGCKEIAFEKVEDAMSAFQTYVTWPYDQQKAWRKILD